MVRSRLREDQLRDEDVLTEDEHSNTLHYFTDLADTPATFSGSGNKYVRVKSDESILEFTSTATVETWVEKTADCTAYVDDNIFINSVSGTFTVTMPSTPSIGNTVSFIDGEGYCATNNVTISGAGEKIMGLDENMAVDVDYASFDLVYYDSGDGWIIK